jgi:pimeloyl-ACP methyl ester carboxylesterase
MRRLIIACISFTFSTQLIAQHSSLIYEKLHPSDGKVSDLLYGTYAVFENPETRSGRMINLNIVVVPSLRRDSTATPIFFFEGGPGLAATRNASFFADRTLPYRKYHDIVLVDIRGSGNSNPLNCPSLQIKNNIEEQMDEMYPKEAVKECYESLKKIADLTQYTTTNVVGDLEEIRKWLGYEKINIFGLSYGTRVALVYMKMFPASIESCILWSPVPTYAKMPLYHAKFAEKSLEKIFNDCRQSSACHQAFPNIEKEFASMKSGFKNVGWKYLFENNSQTISIPWSAFQTKLRSMMYAPDGIRQIPYIVHQAFLGDMKPFIALYPTYADSSYFLAEGLYLCVTCAEDVPFIQSKEINAETKGTFMGTYRVDQQKSACALWARGKIPKDFLEPTKADIPTLIFSGGFDPVTPTSMAKEIASHLTRSTLVIIPQMSHTFEGLSHPECFDNICVEFIDHPERSKLNLNCIKEMSSPSYKLKE